MHGQSSTRRTILQAITVPLIFGLAGCSSSPRSADTTDTTTTTTTTRTKKTTKTTSESISADDLPEGVSPEGFQAEAVIDAHLSLLGSTNYAYQYGETNDTNDFPLSSNVVIRSNRDTKQREKTYEASEPDDEISGARYRDGDLVYYKRTRDGETEYGREEPDVSFAERHQRTARGNIVSIYNVMESLRMGMYTITGTTTHLGNEVYKFKLDSLADEVKETVSASDITVLIQSNGLIHRVKTDTKFREDDQEFNYQLHYEVKELDSVPIETPTWVSEV